MKFTHLAAIVFSLWLPLAGAESIHPDKTLRVELSPYKNSKLYCEDDDIKPDRNNFELLDYSLMSSDNGERFALLTIKNTASGQRLFNQEHIVAILGDCSRKRPANIETKLSAGEILTLRLSFGFSQYPILKLVNE